MGSLKKFVKWLSGDKVSNGSGGKKDPVRSTIIGVKIFTRRLNRQVKKMEVQAKRSRKKAIKRRKAGDLSGSRLHMKSSLQFRKWANATDNFRVRMEGVKFKLEQAQAMNDFSSVAKDIAGILGQLQQTVKAPEIANLLSQLDLGFGNIEAMMGEVTDSLEDSEAASVNSVSDDEVDDALAEIDAELSIDTRSALPSAPSAVGASKKQGDEDISDLEAEIQKLKNRRT